MTDGNNYKETLKEIFDKFKKYNLKTLDEWMESDLEELAHRDNEYRAFLEVINIRLEHKLEMGEFPFYKISYDEYSEEFREEFRKIFKYNAGSPAYQSPLWREFKKGWSDQGIGVEVDEDIERDFIIIYLTPEVVKYREPVGVYNG